MKVIVSNRKARYDFAIMETFEAGLALMGTEVKSLREGKANLRDSFASVENGELILHGLHISPYSHSSVTEVDPRRDRKLLVKKREIRRLTGKIKEKGLTLVPLKLYFNERGLAKVELALAKGKRSYDKRHAIAERDADRDLRREMKDKY